ncbi:MAG: hypothetical protein ACXWZM_06245 [Solirubrobacterales bacterium]
MSTNLVSGVTGTAENLSGATCPWPWRNPAESIPSRRPAFGTWARVVSLMSLPVRLSSSTSAPPITPEPIDGSG